MRLQKVQSPPRIQLTLCVATRPMIQVGVFVPINGFVRTGIFIMTGLSGYSSLCDVCFWKVFEEVRSFLMHLETSTIKLPTFGKNNLISGNYLKCSAKITSGSRLLGGLACDFYLTQCQILLLTRYHNVYIAAFHSFAFIGVSRPRSWV